MDDLISKQAAIDLLKQMRKDGDMVPWEGKNVFARIRELPTIQPELSTNLAEVGTDCISREQAIDAIEAEKIKHGNYLTSSYVGYEMAEKVVKQLSPIQPKITHCKDCKHWIPYDWMFSEVWRSKNMADYPEDEIGCNCSDMAMKANDFCSRAERRTE